MIYFFNTKTYNDFKIIGVYKNIDEFISDGIDNIVVSDNRTYIKTSFNHNGYYIFYKYTILDFSYHLENIMGSGEYYNMYLKPKRIYDIKHLLQ